MSKGGADRYGVMGYPVSHSRSPIIHRLFAAQTEQNVQYELLQVPPEKLESAIGQFKRTGGKGLNVTLPHKSEVAKLVDELSERAEIAGAVNTLVFRDSGLYGDNTDGIGLVRDLTDNLEFELDGAEVLILGAGGATRGIVQPLLTAGVGTLTIANRTRSRADALAQHFSAFGSVSACRFNDIRDGRYDLIINATSAGVKGDTPPYPEEAVTDLTVCYDLSYALKKTPFAEWAAAAGAARSVMGWGMLVEQAAESFFLWRDVRPDTAEVLKQLKVNA